MIQNLVQALREIVGDPEFYVKIGNMNNYTWDYGAMLEYMSAIIVLCIVISSVFKFLRKVL